MQRTLDFAGFDELVILVSDVNLISPKLFKTHCYDYSGLYVSYEKSDDFWVSEHSYGGEIISKFYICFWVSKSIQTRKATTPKAFARW
jgi:hypothetical protein